MNRMAYRTTGFGVRAVYNLTRARINIHGKENIPQGSLLFVVNHFTRIETLFLPAFIFEITRNPVWSLADHEFFKGNLGTFLDMIGAVSTRDPDRDRLIVKSLLTGEASWIIYPEGRMVKSKKIVEKGRYVVSFAGGKHPPHTGAATLALRTEFYRRRMRILSRDFPEELERLQSLFRIDDLEPVLEGKTWIVPVNITYYPIRARENLLSNLAARFHENIPARVMEEIMVESSMLLSGVDMDMHIGRPIQVDRYLENEAIQKDISSGRKIDFNDVLPSLLAMRKAALAVMSRYMDAIYRMTTVNHDHLFASILRQFPFRKIGETDFRQRVFLAAEGDFGKLGAFFHRGLEEDQIHLLADDRFGRYRDFLAIAMEKDLLRRSGHLLIKNPKKFSMFPDFHRVRLDNPVAVMANEVEPLKKLQWLLFQLSWAPGFWIRRKICRHLMKKAWREYKNDRRKYPADPLPESAGKPLLVRGRNRRMGVLLVHGYLAAPSEVRELARFLGRMGVWVYVPRLKGHGTSPEDLAGRRFQDWVQSVDEGYAMIRSLCRRVVAGGFFTGGALVADLACRVSEVSGVFTINSPFRFDDLSFRFLPPPKLWDRMRGMIHAESPRKNHLAVVSERPEVTYRWSPYSGVKELERFMEQLEPKLPGLRRALLVLQAAGDPMVREKRARKMFEKIGSSDKVYELINLDRHDILSGEGSLPVLRAVGDFVKRISESP